MPKNSGVCRYATGVFSPRTMLRRSNRARVRSRWLLSPSRLPCGVWSPARVPVRLLLSTGWWLLTALPLRRLLPGAVAAPPWRRSASPFGALHVPSPPGVVVASPWCLPASTFRAGWPAAVGRRRGTPGYFVAVGSLASVASGRCVALRRVRPRRVPRFAGRLSSVRLVRGDALFARSSAVSLAASPAVYRLLRRRRRFLHLQDAGQPDGPESGLGADWTGDRSTRSAVAHNNLGKSARHGAVTSHRGVPRPSAQADYAQRIATLLRPEQRQHTRP